MRARRVSGGSIITESVWYVIYRHFWDRSMKTINAGLTSDPSGQPATRSDHFPGIFLKEVSWPCQETIGIHTSDCTTDPAPFNGAGEIMLPLV